MHDEYRKALEDMEQAIKNWYQIKPENKVRQHITKLFLKLLFVLYAQKGEKPGQ